MGSGFSVGRVALALALALALFGAFTGAGCAIDLAPWGENVVRC